MTCLKTIFLLRLQLYFRRSYVTTQSMNVRQLFNQLMDQYVGKLHFAFRICEIPLVKHHTPFKTVPALLIAKSENMVRIYHHLYKLLLLIHWKIGDISLEEGPDYWYLAEHLSRKIVKCVYPAGTTTLNQRWKLVVTLNNQNSTLFQRYNFYVEFATLNLRWYYVVGTTLKTATLFQRWTFNLLSSKGMNY